MPRFLSLTHLARLRLRHLPVATARGGRGSRGLALVATLLVAALISATFSSAVVQAQYDPDEAEATSTYISPTYGYTLSWDASWVVIGEDSGSYGDLLWLYHPVEFTLNSFVPPTIVSVISGPAPGLDLASCVAYSAATAVSLMGLANAVPALDERGQPLQAATSTYAAAGFYAQLQGNTLVGYAGDWVAVYVQCQPMPDDGVMIVGTVTWAAPGPGGGSPTMDGSLPGGGMLNCDPQGGCMYNGTDVFGHDISA